MHGGALVSSCGSFALATRGSRLPELLEPVGCQFRVSNGLLNVFVTQVALECAGIVPFVGQCIAACVAQHVRVGFEG